MHAFLHLRQSMQNLFVPRRSRLGAWLAGALLLGSPTLHAADQTVTGNLTVTANATVANDFDAGWSWVTLTGTEKPGNSGTWLHFNLDLSDITTVASATTYVIPGLNIGVTNGTIANVVNTGYNPNTSWTWQEGLTNVVGGVLYFNGTPATQMSLSNLGVLTVYNASNASNTLTLDPANQKIAFSSGATLMGNSTTISIYAGSGLTFNGTTGLPTGSGNYMLFDAVRGVFAAGNITGSSDLTGDGEVAIGYAVTNSGWGSVALGVSVSALGASAVSIGGGTYAGHSSAVSIGGGTSAYNLGGVALGSNSTEIGGEGAVAIGNTALADFIGAVSIGNLTVANGTGAVALGNISNATGAGSIAIGNNNTVNATNAVAIGANVRVQAVSGNTGNNSIAIGSSASVKGANSIAIGGHVDLTNAYYPTDGIAIGGTNWGWSGISVGPNSGVYNDAGIAMGYASYVGGDPYNGTMGNAWGSASIGTGDFALGGGAISFGAYNRATGDGAIGLGNRNLGNGTAAVAIGGYSNATGDYTTAIGANNTVTGNSSVALGHHINITTDSAVVAGVAAGTGTYITTNFYNGTTTHNNSTAYTFPSGSGASSPLFVLGNGTVAITSNGTATTVNATLGTALTVLKNGTVVIPKRQGDIVMGSFGNGGGD